MDWIVVTGSRPRELVSWTPEARWLFQQIINDASGVPGVKAGPRMRRPIIMVNRQIPVAGYGDGIAVRLDPERTQQVVQIPGCLLLGKGDRPKILRGMVSLPWSARDHWRELARAAIMLVPPR
jgi:hypothetical protein